MIRDIITNETEQGIEALSEPCFPVDIEQSELTQQVVQDLVDTADDYNRRKMEAGDRGRCIGLSANQIGEFIRVFIMLVGRNQWLICINPTIRKASEKTGRTKEGCLSRPGCAPVTMERHKRVDLEFYGRDGKKYRMKFKGQEAVCAQHELDHLDGRPV